MSFKPGDRVRLVEKRGWSYSGAEGIVEEALIDPENYMVSKYGEGAYVRLFGDGTPSRQTKVYFAFDEMETAQ